MRMYSILESMIGSKENYRKTRGSTAGFSALEFIVSLSIIMLISAQILISFSSLGQNAALNEAAQELVGQIRKAQYTSLAVTYANVPIGGVPSYVFPPAVGIKFDMATPNQAILFADRNESGYTQNYKYNDTGERISTYTLPANVKINTINGNTNGVFHILFTTPEATVYLTDGVGALLTPQSRLDIELIGAKGAKKTITVQITGQVNVH